MVKRRHSDGGFSLIELLMVVLIIGILSAIAIAAFTKNIDRAHKADGLQRIHEALVTLRSAYIGKPFSEGIIPYEMWSENPTGAYARDADPGTPGHQVAEPPDSASPGNGVDPTQFWISDGTNSHTLPTRTEVVICGLTEGSWIICLYDDQQKDNAVIGEFTSQDNPTKHIAFNDLDGDYIIGEPCDYPSREKILKLPPCA